MKAWLRKWLGIPDNASVFFDIGVELGELDSRLADLEATVDDTAKNLNRLEDAGCTGDCGCAYN